jgi:hypothetical protein
MLYIHHVPGRLRLQTPQVKGNGPVAEAARDAANAIPGVSEARVSAVTGSLVITYDQRELTPATLWQALCERGLASGPLLIQEGVPVTRARIGVPKGAAGKSWVELLAGIILDRLLERSAVALLGALI